MVCDLRGLTRSSTCILPSVGGVSGELWTIAEPLWSRAEHTAYIFRDGLSKQISHATDSTTLGLSDRTNNHCTHFVSYGSLEMGFWKWHLVGSVSVNVSFQYGEHSIGGLSKKW